MSLHRHNPAELSPPTGFSHAVTATGTRFVFLAGQTALDSEGTVVGDTLTEQFTTALGNLLTALRHAGGTPPTSRASPSTPPTSTTTVPTPMNSAESGAGWPAVTTRRWPSSESCGSGTSRLGWSWTASLSWTSRRTLDQLVTRRGLA